MWHYCCYVNWQEFLEAAPERVVEVIKEGPMPLKEYSGSKLTWSDKKRGMMRFKGGSGRSPKLSPKSSYAAVVYFDDIFCEGEYKPDFVPDYVRDRHNMENVEEEFRQL